MGLKVIHSKVPSSVLVLLLQRRHIQTGIFQNIIWVFLLFFSCFLINLHYKILFGIDIFESWLAIYYSCPRCLMSESTQHLGLIGSPVIIKTPTIKLNKNIQGVPRNLAVARRFSDLWINLRQFFEYLILEVKFDY